MPTFRLIETHIRGLYWGGNGCIYAKEEGVEDRCSHCGRWTQTAFRWSDRLICGRHIRVVRTDRIRVLTTFACRVYREGGCPPATVVRRNDLIAVTGRPERVGRYDKFVVPQGGFILVPRSRWAWASARSS